MHTQSDHFINVIRHHKAHPDDFKAKVKYYQKKDGKSISINIKGNGKFDCNGENSFPTGFFDATIELLFDMNKG